MAACCRAICRWFQGWFPASGQPVHQVGWLRHVHRGRINGRLLAALELGSRSSITLAVARCALENCLSEYLAC
jgi:hypothetical protein